MENGLNGTVQEGIRSLKENMNMIRKKGFGRNGMRMDNIDPKVSGVMMG